MKRPSYRDAIRWIAENDEPGVYCPGNGSTTLQNVLGLSEQVTVALVADIFQLDEKKVASAVYSQRLQEAKAAETADKE